MNLLILTTHLNQGGISRYALNLAGGLSSGNTVWLASSGGCWQNRIKDSGARFLLLPIRTKSILSLKIFLSLWKLVVFSAHNRIDLVIANTRVTQFLAYLLFRGLGIKYVSVFHGFYRPTFMRRCLRFEGNGTIAVSRSVREHLIKDLKISPEKIKVVYNGINKESFYPRKDREKDETFILGVLGRISAEKGHDTVLEAFKELDKKYGGLRLFICGRGRLSSWFEDRVVKSGLKDKVRFFSLEGEEFLDIIDVLVSVSEKEGFGFTVLEAFAKGVCVVASSVGGLKEVVRDGFNGLLVRPKDVPGLAGAIEELINDPGLREKLISGGRSSLDKFSLNRMSEETESFFTEVLSYE